MGNELMAMTNGWPRLALYIAWMIAMHKWQFDNGPKPEPFRKVTGA